MNGDNELAQIVANCLPRFLRICDKVSAGRAIARVLAIVIRSNIRFAKFRRRLLRFASQV